MDSLAPCIASSGYASFDISRFLQTIRRLKPMSCSSTFSGAKQKFDENEKLIEEIHYREGILHGKRTIWAPSGEKAGESNYVNGLLHGACELWNSGGQMILKTAYVEGRLHGTYITWRDNGSIKELGQYENGVRVGKYFWYVECGELISQHDYSPSPGV